MSVEPRVVKLPVELSSELLWGCSWRRRCRRRLKFDLAKCLWSTSIAQIRYFVCLKVATWGGGQSGP
eukprot:COSAG05_NODE_13355_length_433_cov_1.083832_2_plen_67_part_00